MRNQGFLLISVMILLVLFFGLLTGYMVLTRTEYGSINASQRQTAGFYAAEAGLNLRAEEIRTRFVGFNRPSGSSPSRTNPCRGSNLGSGDFACRTYQLGGRQIHTYVVEAPNNPQNVRIPPGELYENLDAQEFRYSLYSEAIGRDGQPEAILELVFKSRLVNMFQFMAYYDKDLEILPGPNMLLNGRVHTNGDLYLNSNNTLSISGQVSTARSLYRGRKNSNECTGTVRVARPDNSYGILSCGVGGRRSFSQTDLTGWGERIQVGVNRTAVPAAEELEPLPSRTYFQRADLRVVLDLNQTPPRIRVLDPNGLENLTATTTLGVCGAVSSPATPSLYNAREGKWIRTLDVDMRQLLNCIHTRSLLGTRGLDDNTDGGLIFHFSVLGPDSGRVNNYGVRIRNADSLTSTITGAPRPRGVSVISDQSVYLQGNYNRERGTDGTGFIPAAVMADNIHVLSNSWNDARSARPLSSRRASSTTINAAFYANTDTTGGVEGPGGQGGAYGGGLENYPRFLEDWGNATFTYRGSFVSLGNPRTVSGPWGTGGVYSPPIRDWAFETEFAAGRLPPLSPRFVYLRQERFLRSFER